MSATNPFEGLSTPEKLDVAAVCYNHYGGRLGSHLKYTGFNSVDAKKRVIQRKLKERAGAITQVSLIVDTPSQSIRNVHRSPGTMRQIVVDRMKENLDPKDVNSDSFEKISKKVSELTGVQLSTGSLQKSWWERLGGTDKRKQSSDKGRGSDSSAENP
jgi:hypothetical protein